MASQNFDEIEKQITEILKGQLQNISIKPSLYIEVKEITNLLITKLDLIYGQINGTKIKIVDDFSGTAMDTFVNSLETQCELINEAIEMLKNFSSLNQALLDNYQNLYAKESKSLVLDNYDYSKRLNSIKQEIETFINKLHDKLSVSNILPHSEQYYQNEYYDCNRLDYLTEASYNK
ncbi:MAG: hypothetical protein ACRC5R_00775, partial [Mycoplasmatales bacterium]